MKKNTMMRLASALLVLVLLTTCAISGTFAKYTSTAAGDDYARVAYWGFGLDSAIEIDDLFVDVYDGNNDTSVDSKDGDDVIAPGTKNFKTFKFAYTDNANEGATAPEVAYTFTVDVSDAGTVADLKTAIEQTNSSYPAANLRLIHTGKIAVSELYSKVP